MLRNKLIATFTMALMLLVNTTPVLASEDEATSDSDININYIN